MDDDSFPIIALVCSAGGLEALSTILRGVTAGSPAAWIILQHTSPEHPNALAAILDRQTALDVAPAREGSELVPGRALVAPSGRHTLITARLSVALIPSGTAPPYRPSADLLLTTLALAAGPRAVAVVLTGLGNDAATGATAVHHCGGTVVVSSPATSTQPSMPRATIMRGDVTDHVVALPDAAELLTLIAGGPGPSRPAG